MTAPAGGLPVVLPRAPAALLAFCDVAARLHKVIVAAAPGLNPRRWYGMPGYATSARSPVPGNRHVCVTTTRNPAERRRARMTSPSIT